MAELSLKVSDFEGPLDLLIHLIEKDKIDIYDIPIAEITEQYIAYLSAMAEFDMEIASEFLVMAATLLQIKSRMLLPKPVLETDEDEADPRAMLVEMLIEYRRIKECAAKLARMKDEAARYVCRKPLAEGKITRRIAQYTAADLVKSLLALLAASHETIAYVERQEFSVQEKMAEIVSMLKRRLNGMEFKEVFCKTGTRSEKIAGFLALLELLKLNVITITQTQPFAPIYIFLHREDENNVS